MFALDSSSAGRQRRQPSYNWLFRQHGDNAPLVRVDCSPLTSASRRQQGTEQRESDESSSSSSSRQRAVDNDDDDDDDDWFLGKPASWLVCQVDGEQQKHTGNNEDGNELRRVPPPPRETAEHLTFEYVHQLVAALQEARRHLDSLAAFVNANESVVVDENILIANPKSCQGYCRRDADTRQQENDDQIPWEIICDQLKNICGDTVTAYADGGARESDTKNRSISTQTEENDVIILRGNNNVTSAACNRSNSTAPVDQVFGARKPIGRTGNKLPLNYAEKTLHQQHDGGGRSRNPDGNQRHEKRTTAGRRFAGRDQSRPSLLELSCKSDAIVRRWLNNAWASAGRRSWQRLSLLGRDYRKLHGRHATLRRRYHRQRRRFRYLERQHQILLQSIGSQIDELALDWAHRVRHLLIATGPAGQQSNRLDNGINDSDVTDAICRSCRRTTNKRRNAGWQQWHTILSLKLDWVRSSHGTVVDHLLVRLGSPVIER